MGATTERVQVHGEKQMQLVLGAVVVQPRGFSDVRRAADAPINPGFEERP